ncbi:hypothetical protein D3C81_888380 [compost metagenome]
MRPGTHDDAAPAGAIAFSHALDAINNAGRRKIGRRHQFDQVIHRGVGIAQQMQAGVHHLIEVMRGDIGGHTHRNTRRAIDQQIRNTRRQNTRFFFRTVVVRLEIDSFLVDIVEHFMRDLRQADFRITHGCRVIPIDRAEVALAVYQQVAQREILRHADDRVINGGVAVRVILTDHITDNTGRFLIGSVPVVIQLMHRKEHAPMYWFQAIPDVGKRTPDDNAHRVIQV